MLFLYGIVAQYKIKYSYILYESTVVLDGFEALFVFYAAVAKLFFELVHELSRV